MRLLVIDTCIINEDFFLQKDAIVSLERWCRSLGFTLCFPDIVLTELVRHYRARLRDTRVNANTFLRLICRGQHRVYKEQCVDAAVQEYAQALRSRALQIGKIVKVPPWAGDFLNSKYRTASKPYDEKRNGFADVLLWATVLSLAESHEVHLVSANKKDFLGDSAEFTCELQSDIRARKIPENRIKFHSSMRSFSESVVQPHQARNKQLADYAVHVASGCFQGVNLLEWVLANFCDYVTAADLDKVTATVESRLESACFEGPEEVSRMRDTLVYDLNPGSLLLVFTVDVSLVYTGYCWEDDLSPEMKSLEYGLFDTGGDICQVILSRKCVAEVCLIVWEECGSVYHGNISGLVPICES